MQIINNDRETREDTIEKGRPTKEAGGEESKESR